MNVAFIYAGNYLRSHTLSRAVPSAQRGLTSVFGMGTGGTLPTESPEKCELNSTAGLSSANLTVFDLWTLVFDFFRR